MDVQEKVHQSSNAATAAVTMPMKKWFRRMQPAPLYAVLALSLGYFIGSLVISHTTHSLTLLMVSYHMLCNIIAMIGCIFTIKHAKQRSLRQEVRDETKTGAGVAQISGSVPQGICESELKRSKSLTQVNQAHKLRNTFGWARIDILVMLICCVFLASLCFSLIVEALQTLLHIDHQDEMHEPIIVFGFGIAAVVLNLICYCLIGGYTFHQGSFLFLNATGDVILDVVTTDQGVSKGERRLSKSRSAPNASRSRQRQGFIEMLRDLFGAILVIITSIIIYFCSEDVGKFIDPAFAILSGVVLLILSFPYMKESCLILLQTIPDTMDIESTQKQLLKNFPDILSVHDFHVWQLTTHKVISTVHIIFQNPRVYTKIIAEINQFFEERGVTQLTVQPEFCVKSCDAGSALTCLMKCKSQLCISSSCCPEYEKDATKHEHGDCKKRKNANNTKATSLESVRVENLAKTNATSHESFKSMK